MCCWSDAFERGSLIRCVPRLSQAHRLADTLRKRVDDLYLKIEEGSKAGTITSKEGSRMVVDLQDVSGCGSVWTMRGCGSLWTVRGRGSVHVDHEGVW